MFDTLQDKLTGVIDKIRGRGLVTESVVDKVIDELKTVLLEADVALEVVNSFLEKVRARAIGSEVIKSVSPAQQVIKIIHDELVKTLSGEDDEISHELKLKGGNAPYFVMAVGLQGVGKTTTAAKLAKYLKDNDNRKVLLVSLDVARPGAQEQLEFLAKQNELDSLPIVIGENPLDITKRAINYAKLNSYDVVLLDTAGRMHLDDSLMLEVSQIKQIASPKEILLVADSLAGQDSVNIAKSFNERLDITGLILTRVDGDGRGGAALSMKEVTGVPIKFMGVGEKVDEFEKFDAKRIADRILGQGDVVGLVEKASKFADEKEAKKIAERMSKGKFDMNDLKSQYGQMKKMGGLSGVMGMLPGVGKIKKQMSAMGFDESVFKRQEAIIDSMTKGERSNPKIIHASRKKRIAVGSGTTVQEINKLIKQHATMAKTMKRMASGGGMPNLPAGMKLPKGLGF